MVDVVIESMVEMANVVVFSGDGKCSDSEYGGDDRPVWVVVARWQ